MIIMTKRITTTEELKNWLFDLWEHNYFIRINDISFDTVRLNMYYDRMLDNLEFYSLEDKAPVCVINLLNIKSVCGYDIEIIDSFITNKKEN